MRSRRRKIHPTIPRLTRLVLMLALMAPLGGCSSDSGTDDWASLFEAARSAWVNRDAPVALSEAAAIPYATIGLRIDGGQEQILLLATDTNGERLWTSAARIAISTRNGRIVRTAGFGSDLSGFDAANENAEDWNQPHTMSWTADFADLGVYSTAIVCTVTPSAPEPIEILGKQIDTRKVDETCRSDSLDWTFTNTYWVSAQSGRVWRMTQHIHPKGPVLEIELLRPPIGPG